MSSGSPDAPVYRYSFTSDQQIVLNAGGGTRLVSGFHVEDEHISLAFGSVISVELADFTDVVMAVHMADRISPRAPPHTRDPQDSWCRCFHLRIPVRDAALWSSPAVQGELRNTLNHLTDDHWEFDFVARNGEARVSESQHFLFRTPPKLPVSAALFSGGLDSLAGLYVDLVERPQDSVVLFSAATSSRLGQHQRELLRHLAEHSGRRLRTIVVPLGLRRRDGYCRGERTQRTRGFVFTGLGAVSAIAAGAEELALYENGVGAINLPYTAAQLGAHSTRSSHPLFLRRMECLIQSVTGRSVWLRLPFLLRTKAEICAPLRDSGWENLIPHTVSCHGFPQRVSGKSQCGVCTSCVLRRQSLHTADLGTLDFPDRYRWDVLGPHANIPPAKLYDLHAMLDQANRLRQLTCQDDSYSRLAREYPQIAELAHGLATEPADVTRRGDELADMYRRYTREWETFPLPGGRQRAGRAA